MLKGLIPVLLTPMLKDNRIDSNGMKKLINLKKIMRKK